MTRRSLSAHKFTKSCYFCEGHGGDLRECQTLQVDSHVRNIANELGDKKLLAKFSEGDMVPTEAMYHSKCLVQLYKRYRSNIRSKTSAESDTVRIQGLHYQKWFPSLRIVLSYRRRVCLQYSA